MLKFVPLNLTHFLLEVHSLEPLVIDDRIALGSLDRRLELAKFGKAKT